MPSLKHFDPAGQPSLDLSAIREKLAASPGPGLWRSLDELADTPEFRAFLDHEFPRLGALWEMPLDRRRFFQLMGASLALAGVTGCQRYPAEEIVPYVEKPELVVPGKPLYFATAVEYHGFAQGVLAENHMGRPTRLEGNPEHPATLGALDTLGQASILDLWDPGRSEAVTLDNRISTWERFIAELGERRGPMLAREGQGLAILTGAFTSPSLHRQIEYLRERWFPRLRWYQHDPVDRGAIYEGAEMALGEALETRCWVDRADVIVSLDADFLGQGPFRLRYARQFAARREIDAGNPMMNRLYVLEATPSITGASADHRLALPALRMEAAARHLASRLGLDVETADMPGGLEEHWLDALVEDLEAHRGASLVLAGDQQPPAVHALAHAINHELGNVGETVEYSEPVAFRGAPLPGLAAAIDAGEVDTLLILDSNVAYNAPADLGMDARLEAVPFSVYLGTHPDETARHCRWHIPMAHPLESWGDCRALDGTVTVRQPLIAPLHGGRTAHELMAVLMGEYQMSDREIVYNYWQARFRADGRDGDFETFWVRTLHDGVMPDSALPARTAQPVADWVSRLPAPALAAPGVVLQFRPDPAVWDGRFAGNAWLQELPRPLTKQVWGNAALVSPATAQQLNLEDRQVVEIRNQGFIQRWPLWIMPGMPEGVVTLNLGYGRIHAGEVGSHVGVNAYRLRTHEHPWAVGGVEVHATDAFETLVSTQHHHSMEGREPVRRTTLEKLRQGEAVEQHHPEHSLYPEYEYPDYKWGMVVNLNTCIGCNACITACQAENNIPVVGPEEVARGHEMHWLRVDRYYEGGLDDPEIHFQPVPCMHCEKAPCEYVCPVEATLHDSEGLNQMVYNRCVGTRYCSQNCPYKVRRFNWFHYTGDDRTPNPVYNPDVTVRSRGVMEKCTYCVQRINAARIEAKKEGREIRDGEVVTACQSACPTRAITFGDLNDPDSAVAALQDHPLQYSLLAELNTRPRTTFLASVRNPNPALEEGEG